jgi:hypothetical protein
MKEINSNEMVVGGLTPRLTDFQRAASKLLLASASNECAKCASRCAQTGIRESGLGVNLGICICDSAIGGRAPLKTTAIKMRIGRASVIIIAA